MSDLTTGEIVVFIAGVCVICAGSWFMWAINIGPLARFFPRGRFQWRPKS